MRILFTNTGPWGTGSFSFVKSLMTELENYGHEVKIFFPNTQKPSSELTEYRKDPRFVMWDFPISDDVTTLESFPCILPDIHPQSTNSSTFKTLSNKEFSLYFSKLSEALSPLLNEWRPDVIDCQHIWAMQKIVQDLGFPCCCSVHHSDIMAFRFDERMQPIVIQGAAHASHIFTLSELDKADVVSLYSVDPKKISVMPCGYNPKLFYPAKGNRGKVLKELEITLPSDAQICTFIGIISKNKGVDLIIQAANSLPKESNIHFIIVGSGRMEGLNHPRLHCVGYRAHNYLAEILHISCLLVLPSRNEGFGTVCLEAMACGVPTVVTEGNGMVDYAIGRIIPQENSEAIATACMELTTMDKAAYESLSSQALEKASEFLWTDIVKKRLKIYESMSK
jgi:glycosyltransferase involved in cell wall biosynthesis